MQYFFMVVLCVVSSNESEERYLAIKDEGGRACHINMAIGLAPFNVQRAAIHHNIGLARSTLRNGGRHSGGASACATGQGDAAATLPYTGANGAVGQHLRKLDVAALRKSIIMFKLFAVASYVEVFNVLGENHKIRVTHRHEGASERTKGGGKTVTFVLVILFGA